MLTNYGRSLKWCGFVLLAAMSFQNIPVRAESKNDPIIVLATIKPVQLISQAIAGSYAQVDVLLPPLVSPHLYQLKPSDRSKLEQAALLVWVGPDMERFLVKPLSFLEDGRILQLLEEDSVESGGEEGRATVGHSGHDHGQDPHIWLGPAKALVIAERVALRLSAISPEHRQGFSANLANFRQQLTSLDRELQQQFAAIDAKPYLVLHDGYSHFEQHYGIRRAAALTLSPDRKPGAKHLWTLQKQIAQGDIACVFTEPQYQPAILNSLIGDTEVKTQQLDPMASAIAANDGGYVQYLKEFAENFLGCL